MRFIIPCLIAIAVLCSDLKAQGEAAVPFLLIQPSADIQGMAGAYTGLPSNDSFGFFYNPAQIGNFGRTDNLSIGYMHAEWLPQFDFSDLYFESSGFSSGYSLSRLPRPIPVNFGFGYMKGYLNLGENVWTDETGAELGRFESKEWYDAYAFGASFDWYFLISAGFTYKSITSRLAPPIIIGSETKEYNFDAKANAFDFGALVTMPFDRLYYGVFSGMFTERFMLYPVTNLSFGLTLNNVGDKIKYIDAAQKDPLPREAKIGYGLNMGLNMILNGISMDLFKVQLASEADDIMIKRLDDGGWKYTSFAEDISIKKNILQKHGDEKVVNRNGYSVECAEIIRFSYGKFYGHGYSNIKTEGYSVRARGILKLVAALVYPGHSLKILPHFDLVYSSSIYETADRAHPLNETEFKCLSLAVYGF
jgi:hypothetical protein